MCQQKPDNEIGRIRDGQHATVDKSDTGIFPCRHRDCQRPVVEAFGVWVYSGSSLCPVYVGGNYNSNPNYGLWHFNANNSASNSNANLGSRILFKKRKIYCAGSSVALAKNLVSEAGISSQVESP